MTALRKQTAADALKRIQGDEALVEELLDWTSETLAWLAAKENNSTPEDLVTADALLREHLVRCSSILYSLLFGLHNECLETFSLIVIVA